MRPLVQDKLFHVTWRRLPAGGSLALGGGRMNILGVVEGALRVNDMDESTALPAGGFCLVPACCGTRWRGRMATLRSCKFSWVEPC